MPKHVMVSTDIGNICSVSNSYLRFDEPNSMLAAMSFGNCGYALPALIGAKLGRPDRPAVAYVGDGAWCMSFQELLTCVRERIPVTAVVFHNGQWGAEKKNQVDYGRRFVGSNLQNPNFAELARAMGAEGLRVEHADQVGDALRAACKAQSEGKTTVLEMMVSQELGDPFRRDALKQPVRFLKKYQPYVNQPFASGKRRCRSSRRDTRREDGRAPDPEVRMRSRGSGAGIRRGLPMRPRLAARRRAGPRPARRAAAPAGAKDGERWIVRAAARCRIVGGPAAHGGGISLVRVQPGRGGSGARGRLYRAGAGGAARAHRAAAGGIGPAGRRAGNHRRARRRAGIGAGRGGAGARRRRGHADEGQPAQRSFHGGGGGARVGPAHGEAHQPCLRDVGRGLSQAVHPDGRGGQHRAHAGRRPTSRRTPSTWRARWAWTGPRWRCCARQNR